MNKVAIVTILNESDLSALPKFVERFSENKLAACIVLHNPHLGIAAPENAPNPQLASLQTAIDAAVKREDFDAAKQLKEQRDALVVAAQTERDKGWKAMTPEQRKPRYDALFTALGGCASAVLRYPLLEAVSGESLPELFHAIQRVSQAFPKELKNGGFVIGSPIAFLPRATSVEKASETTAPSRENTNVVVAKAAVAAAALPSPTVTRGVPSISASAFTTMNKATAESLSKQLGGPVNGTLAELKAFIKDQGVVKPPQASPFIKKA